MTGHGSNKRGMHEWSMSTTKSGVVPLLAGCSKSSKKWHRKAAAMLFLVSCTERPFGASAAKSPYASHAGGEVLRQPTLPARSHGLLPARSHGLVARIRGRLDHAWRAHHGVHHGVARLDPCRSWRTSTRRPNITTRAVPKRPNITTRTVPKTRVREEQGTQLRAL